MGTVNLLNGGLDVQGIVDNLIYVEREPIRRLERSIKGYETRASAYQEFNTKLLAFKTSIESLLYHGDSVPLTTPASFNDRLSNSLFALRTATSSDETVLTATANKGVTTGQFTVTVSQLARADSYASNNFASDTDTQTQTGTLIIQRGADDPVTITIDDTNNTMQGVKNAINAADAGFTASIINDGSATPYRLVITSDESGTANALSITNNINQGGGQSLTLAQTVIAQDASVQINGVDIASSSNTITDAIEGITLNLKAESGTAVVDVGRDLEAIVEGIKDFVEKYNEVISYISSQSRYNAEDEKAGILSGDITLRITQSQLSSSLLQRIDSDEAALTVLSQIGIHFNNDGTLTVNEEDLEDALSSSFQAAAHVLLADALDQGGSSVSIGPQLLRQLKGLTDPLEGPVLNAKDSVQKNIDRIQDQIERMEERLEVRREILISQFSRADQALRQLTVLQSALTGQINSLQAFQ